MAIDEDGYSYIGYVFREREYLDWLNDGLP